MCIFSKSGLRTDAAKKADFSMNIQCNEVYNQIKIHDFLDTLARPYDATTSFFSPPKPQLFVATISGTAIRADHRKASHFEFPYCKAACY